MQNEQLKILQSFKTTAVYGSGFGLIFIILSFIGSGYNDLLGIGIGLTAASVVLFLFGTFLSLMEEYTFAAKGKVKMVESSRKQ